MRGRATFPVSLAEERAGFTNGSSMAGRKGPFSRKGRDETMRLGSGQFVYEEVDGWGEVPDGWSMGEAPGVAVDSQDRVYVFCRSEHPIIVFDRDGRFLRAWGEGMIKRAHDIIVGPDDSIYCVDDWGHAVHKFTPEGDLLMSIETAESPADTGYIWDVQKEVLRAGPPFNYPTGIALSPEGELYVSDGYGNARVHKFTAEGELLFSWGEPGTGAGQFVTPHNVCVDGDGTVYVADRQNRRMQLFSSQGELIGQWDDVWWPCDMCIDAEGHMYLAEVGGIFMGETKVPVPENPPARITVRDLNGRILSEWGIEDPYGAGRYFSPHNIAFDSRGDLYVGEVSFSYPDGTTPKDWRVLRKYERR